MKLTPTTLVDLLPDEPLSRLTCLSLRNREISHIEDLSRLLPALKRVDLTGNALRHPDALSGLRKCIGVTQLVLQGNQLTELDWISWLPKELHVLNVSRNEIKLLPECINDCHGLRALMLNHNKLKRVDILVNLPELNTLVVSHNQIESLPMLDRLPELVKLSAAHNMLREVPDMRQLIKLRELRLSGNKISNINAELLPANIKVLDLGDNLFTSWDNIEAIRKLKWLNNLNLKGNPIAKMDNYTETIRAWFPRLRVLDDQRIDAKFLDKKEEKKRLAAEATAAVEDQDEGEEEGEEEDKKRKRSADDTDAMEDVLKMPHVTQQLVKQKRKDETNKQVKGQRRIVAPSEEVIAARRRALIFKKTRNSTRGSS
ncbi:hypothetical protein BDF19DRAFT_438957 [Syncephalis fuscata]|nr:hypothetical protein BDF19DRAFT_438957 [Syncephalis fuscata]